MSKRKGKKPAKVRTEFLLQSSHRDRTKEKSFSSFSFLHRRCLEALQMNTFPLISPRYCQDFSWFLYCSFSLQFFFSFKNETSVSYLGFLLLFTFLFYFRVLFMHTCLEASPRCVSISTWLHFFTNRIVDRSHEKQNIHSRYQPRNSMNNKLIEHFPLMMVSVILDTQSVSVIVVNIASSGALTHLSG